MVPKASKENISVEEMIARYKRAQNLIQGIFTNTLVRNATLFPVWIGVSDCFWYERETRSGKEYRLVNAKTLTNQCAFDHAVLAKNLSENQGRHIDKNKLPITNVTMDLDSSDMSVQALNFTAFDKRWLFDVKSNHCLEIQNKAVSSDEIISPDGKCLVFTRDHNLWIRDLSNGDVKALTHDGCPDYAYGAVSTAYGVPYGFGLQAHWSPNSRWIFTIQLDKRKIKSTPFVHHVPKNGQIRPLVEHIKVSYPGDDHIEELRLVVIDTKNACHQPVNYRQIPVTRCGYGFFDSKLGWWSADSQRAYFVDVERDYKTARVVELNSHTGSTKVLFEENTDTHINLQLNDDEHPTLMPLPNSSELLWYSERSGWAHLYLYDLETGKLKRPITKGDWLVRNIVHFDAERREVFVQTAGRASDRDPYYRDLCRINLDTSEITALVSSDHEYIAITQTDMNTTIAKGLGRDIGHACGVSHSSNFAVVTRSRADETPVSLLVDRDGKEVLEIEVADISGLPDRWQWPEPVKLMADDGVTDIYGLVYRPTDFSSNKHYPIISHVFNTPELPRVSKGSFSNGAAFGRPYLDAAALAELGFIVVQIDGRGTPLRNKTFFDESYGWAESASTLKDHIAGIKQLASRYPYMDISRMGITSHHSGGPGGVQGLLQYPEFYKVGVNGCLHDSRLFSSSMWGEKYEGLSGPIGDYKYPEQLVENLQGKLLMMHGMLDFPAPPASVFRLVESLQKANKDFDLLLLPNLGHSASNYLTRRTWDYFVSNLLEANPPKQFKLTSIFG